MLNFTASHIKICLFALCAVYLCSCVAYLPPSSMHMDMKPTDHPIYEGEVKHEVSVSATTLNSVYSNRSTPEVERSKNGSVDLHYAIAKEHVSASIGAGYSFGTMIMSRDYTAPHSNFIGRSSLSYDKSFGKFRVNLLKVQLAGSQGYGQYQDTLAAAIDFRDEYNYVFEVGDILYSVGYGSHATSQLNENHAIDLGFYLNHSTDLKRDGFREDFFVLQLGYKFRQNVSLKLGTMTDARLLPRSRSAYASIGYHYTLR